MRENLFKMLDDAINDKDPKLTFCIQYFSMGSLQYRTLRYPKERLPQLKKFIKRRFTEQLIHKKKSIVINSACISREGCSEVADAVALEINEYFVNDMESDGWD